MSAPASRQTSISSRHISGFKAAVGCTNAWIRNFTPSAFVRLISSMKSWCISTMWTPDLVDPARELEHLVEPDRHARHLAPLTERHVHQRDLSRQVHALAHPLVEVVRAHRPHAFAEARYVLPTWGGVRWAADLRARLGRWIDPRVPVGASQTHHHGVSLPVAARSIRVVALRRDARHGTEASARRASFDSPSNHLERGLRARRRCAYAAHDARREPATSRAERSVV